LKPAENGAVYGNLETLETYLLADIVSKIFVNLLSDARIYLGIRDFRSLVSCWRMQLLNENLLPRCESISVHLIDEVISVKETVFKKSKFRKVHYVICFVLFRKCWCLWTSEATVLCFLHHAL